MTHCIRCGGELPSAGAECPECRIAFDDIVEDSAFIDDDEDEEGGDPTSPRSRAARWDAYLETAPVRVDDDLAEEPEEPAPATEPEPEPASAMLEQQEPVTADVRVDEVREVPEVEAPVVEAEPVTAEIEPVAEEPVEIAPVEAAPVEVEPVEMEPVVLEPVVLEPVVTESVVVAAEKVDVDAPADADQSGDEPEPAPATLAYESDAEADDAEVLGPPEPPVADALPAEEEAPESPVVAPIAAPVVQPVLQPVVAPVVAPVAGPVVAPLPNVHTGPASVGIDVRFELHSAPADGAPVVHALVDLEPSGAPLIDGTDGPLAHVVLALDLSASMNDPRKYPVLTRALEHMLVDLKHAREGDVLVSLVVFAYGSETLLRAQPASQLDPREVLQLIDRSPLRFTRYTDLAGALSRAGRIAYDGHLAMPRVPVRVYVLTDGQPQDIELARHKARVLRRVPVDVHGLAFGDDADLGTLQELLCGGRGGTVKHVRSDTLESAFERIAEVARRVVAKRALLDVELKNGVVGGASYRFRPARHAYGKQAFDGGRHFHTDLGTLESGRRYSLLFQVRLPKSEHDETEIGRLTLRIPGEGGPVTFERLLFIARHPGAESPEADAAVVEARHVVEAVGADDPQAHLKALRARRRLYLEEKRDPYIIELIDRAIEEMEKRGSLEALTNGERAALQSHTQSVIGAVR